METSKKKSQSKTIASRLQGLHYLTGTKELEHYWEMPELSYDDLPPKIKRVIKHLNMSKTIGDKINTMRGDAGYKPCTFCDSGFTLDCVKSCTGEHWHSCEECGRKKYIANLE